MNSLLMRQVLAFLLILTIFLVILSLVFSLGLSRSLAGWSEERQEVLESSIYNEIVMLFHAEGVLREDDLRERLLPFTAEVNLLIVTSSDQTILFQFGRGPGMGGAGQGLLNPPIISELPGPLNEQPRMPGRQMRRMAVPVGEFIPVTVGQQVVAKFHFAVPEFRGNQQNELLLNRLFVAVIIGLVLAFGGAIAVALFFSFGLSRRAGEIAVDLASLRHGRRDVQFRHPGIRELESISDSARALQQELIEQESLRRRWSQDISHDLRTPIAAVKAQLEGLVDGVFSAEPERLKRILREIGTVEGLVEDLALLTKVESPEFRLQLEEVELAQLVHEILERMKQLGLVSGEAVKSLGGSQPVISIPPNFTIVGDRKLLTRALSNVIENAFKHSSGTGTVTIAAHLSPKTAEGTITLSVTNPGFIDPASLSLIFERLYRVEEGRSTRGSGLGLSIARAIIERHHGSIVMRQLQSPSCIECEILFQSSSVSSR